MTHDEFVQIARSGGDIMFDCGIRKYTMCVWSGFPIDIAEQVTCANHKTYDTPEKLLDEYIIDDKPLGDQLEKVVITSIN